MKYVKALLSFLIFLLVACSNDAVSSHEVVPIAGDISSSAVTTSSSSRGIVEHSSSSSAEKLSSAEESSSSSELLSSSDECVESSSSSVLQESSSSSAQEESSSSKEYIFYGEMTDERDGQVYKTIYVEGFEQIWMIENLNYAYLQPTAELDSSSMCVWDCVYGRFYLWSAAVDSAALFSNTKEGCGYNVKCSVNEKVRGVCPEGWRLPTYEDYERLMQWRSEPSINFNETQLQEHWSNVEIDLFTSSRIWVLEHADLFYGTVDGWDPHPVTFYPQDLYDVEKRSFNAVRCVRDKEIEE